MRWLVALGGLIVPLQGHAAPSLGPAFFMGVCWLGFACLSNAQVTQNFIGASFFAAAFVAVAIFLVGTALFVFSAGSDTLVQKGRGMMQYSLIGLTLVVGSYAIWRTIVFILYA